jgi:nucleotide-binding universal stress UspA family protein
MTKVLVALDASANASTVLETGLRLGRLIDSEVEAVHVREGPADSPEWLADQAGVPLRILDGPVDASLLDAAGEGDVVATVLGARATSSGGRRVIGSNAVQVLTRTDKPVMVVPPELAARREQFYRLLVPLEGGEQSSLPIVDVLCPLIVADVELVVLHVFTTATLPPALDRPTRDLAIWGTEFLARHCPNASRIELRTGSIARRVNDVCDEEHADLVVLSWSQDNSPDRAAVIHDVLAHSNVPLLLLPVQSASSASVGR